MDDVVEIDFDKYEAVYSAWVLEVYGKAIDNQVYKKFDSYIGLEHNAWLPNSLEGTYTFKIIDKKKYFLSKIKYGF